MRFTGSSSYLRAYGFYEMSYGLSASKPFSLFMWINPSSVVSCPFVQLQTSSSSCINMLGISSATGSTDQIIAQTYNSFMNGPFLTVYTWTHIPWTFSSMNEYTLYVNESLFDFVRSYFIKREEAVVLCNRREKYFFLPSLNFSSQRYTKYCLSRFCDNSK